MKMIDWAKGQCILETHYIPERNCLLEWKQYLDGSPALLVSGSNGERLLTATVWVEDFAAELLKSQQIAIKNWGENFGIYQALVELQVIQPTVSAIPCRGYTAALVCTLGERAKELPGWKLK